MNKTISVNSRTIGEKAPVFIIAEIGINHQGDPALAARLIDAAAEAGADAVKFQKRSVEAVSSKVQYTMPYPGPNSFGATYGEHRHALELEMDAYCMLKRRAEARSLVFFASAWDQESADQLDSLEVPAFKVASADVTNIPLLKYLASKGKPLIISTGMSTLEEVDQAVSTIQQYSVDFALLQCTAAYPPSIDEINLRTIPFLRERYSCPVGYSGHERGIHISIASVALGASILERHLTLDRTMKGGDHKISLIPSELRQLVKGVREVERALGIVEKKIWPSEIQNRLKLAKSIVTTVPVKRGTILSPQMLTIKSPGTGISAGRLSEIVGCIAACDLEGDYVLTERDILPREICLTHQEKWANRL